MRAVDGRDRVELHGLQPADLSRDLVRLRAPEPPGEALVRDDVAAQSRDGHRLWARYSSKSERVTTPTGLPSRATSTAFERPVSAAKTASTDAPSSTAASGGCIAEATSPGTAT